MSDAAFIADPAAPSGVRLRQAGREDAPAVAGAVAELLRELGASPAPARALEEAARSVAGNEDVGVMLVAEDTERRIVGLLGCSWQIAVRVPGRYGLIQELWVARDWRNRAIGHELVDALVDLARERGIGRIEVGLPGEGFVQLEATRAFYLENGFGPVGTRMRRLV